MRICKTPMLSCVSRFAASFLAKVVMASVVVFSGASQVMASSSDADQAVWQEKELRFWYSGLSTYYSCDSLERKMMALLQEFGAKEAPYVRATGCYGINGDVSKTISVKMRFAVPEFNQVASERGEGAEPFTVSMQPVSISSKSLKALDRGDCELVESFTRHVLPSITHEMVKKNGSCIKGFQNEHRMHLKANVLKVEQALKLT